MENSKQFIVHSIFIFGAVIYYFLGLLWVLAFIFSTFLLSSRRKIYLIVKMLPRDIKNIYQMSRLVSATKEYEKKNMTLVDAFYQQLKKTPQKACYLFEDSVWTFQDVENYSNRVANYFSNAGYCKGDVIALVMENRPEYICVWLGLAKLGIITALININIKAKSLGHCIEVANCKSVIFSEKMSSVVLETCQDLPLYQVDGKPKGESMVPLSPYLEGGVTESPEVKENLGYMDKLLYIFTSGTTGLPKAAVLTNSRYIMATMAMFCLLNLRDDDVIYNPLPLYHTTGGALGAGVSLTAGITAVLRSKFSASLYISDCIKYNCTIGQYVGEMCRYILSVPPGPQDVAHKLRCIVGNGLRPAIWEKFVERFNISDVKEFYGSTEGNVNIANLDSKVGAVGCLPLCLPQSFFPVAVIKVDTETELPLRSSDGLCIRCDIGEPGMFVGLIKAKDPSRRFHGYVNKSESNKKILHNVFSQGDSAFVSGDLMVVDELGYIYFKDRTGDTYRWKGENVATAEVESVVSSIAGLRDCVVYGVQIGQMEGRAGMLAVVDTNNSLDLKFLAAELDSSLPSYARPFFVRILPSLELTGTFKLKKIELQKQGFNPNTIIDKLFFRQGSTFVPLTNELHEKIISGDIKL